MKIWELISSSFLDTSLVFSHQDSLMQLRPSTLAALSFVSISSEPIAVGFDEDMTGAAEKYLQKSLKILPHHSAGCRDLESRRAVSCRIGSLVANLDLDLCLVSS